MLSQAWTSFLYLFLCRRYESQRAKVSVQNTTNQLALPKKAKKTSLSTPLNVLQTLSDRQQNEKVNRIFNF